MSPRKVSRRKALIGGGVAVAGGVVAAGSAGLIANRDKPEPASPPAVDGQGRMLWRNWSGIQTAYPVARLAPDSEAALAAGLAAAVAPIRAVGAGHSFTALAATNGTLVSLDALSGLIRWEGDEAVVRAGSRLSALGPLLAARGRAMANLPDINKQSFAGAIATATHGTGQTLKALHGQVTALSLITPDGRRIDCDAKTRPEVFNAARVSLGSLGIITEARIATVPNERLHRHVWVEPFEEALAKAEERWKTHRNFEFYAVPFTGLAANISHDITTDPATPPVAGQDDAFLDALKMLRNTFGWSNGLRKAAAKALLGGAEEENVVGESWKLLSTDRPVRFNEMEYHLPPETQLAALQEVMAMIETERRDVFFPIEVRRTAGDDAWLSPFQGGVRGSIAVHAWYKDDYAFFFELIEPILQRHGGRPHWGKLHSLRGQRLQGLYPNWKDFLAVRAALDPKGRMLSPYLTGLFDLA
jgi:FAD-linked oxidoreductase